MSGGRGRIGFVLDVDARHSGSFFREVEVIQDREKKGWGVNWLRFVDRVGRGIGFVFPADGSIDGGHDSRPGNDRSPCKSQGSAELASFRNPGQGPGWG